jgi:hypothetical protein
MGEEKRETCWRCESAVFCWHCGASYGHIRLALSESVWRRPERLLMEGWDLNLCLCFVWASMRAVLSKWAHSARWWGSGCQTLRGFQCWTARVPDGILSQYFQCYIKYLFIIRFFPLSWVALKCSFLEANLSLIAFVSITVLMSNH